MEKYYYKYIQRLNGNLQGRLNGKKGNLQGTSIQKWKLQKKKKEPNRRYRMKITVCKLKTLLDVLKSIRQCKGKDQ